MPLLGAAPGGQGQGQGAVAAWPPQGLQAQDPGRSAGGATAAGTMSRICFWLADRVLYSRLQVRVWACREGGKGVLRVAKRHAMSVQV